MLGASRRITSNNFPPSTAVSRILELRSAANEPTLSFEFFPPKDAVADGNLWKSFDRLMETAPDFVSVTYGAGGSNRDKSIEVVSRMATVVPTIGHLTCVASSIPGTTEIIKSFEQAGVAAILALRGDKPREAAPDSEAGEFKTALELVNLATRISGIEVGVAAFPEVHPESPNLQHDAQVLALKQNAGAKFAMTQLFFTVDNYLALLKANAEAKVSIPIIPGLMPIANHRQVLRMAELSGAKVPIQLLEELESAEDDALAREIGMNFSTDLGNQLLTAGAPGLHIFSLNQHEAALELARSTELCR